MTLATGPAEAVLIPVGDVRGRFDNDAAHYVFAPDLYSTLALAYDSMAAPSTRRDSAGVASPDFSRMTPRLAESWQETPAGHWEITLRQGVRSPYGNEWNAEDLVFAFDKARDQDVMAAWRWYGVVGVERLEVLDRYRVRYRLRAPYPTFPNWLLSLSPNMIDSTEVRAHASAEDPYGIGWLDANAAGYGAYRLAEHDGDRLLFQPRSDAWTPAPTDVPVEVSRWTDRADAIGQLGESRPVVVLGLDPDETVAAQRQDGVRLLRSWAGHVSVEIDFASAPFDDLRVRHALARAVPYDRIRQDGLLGLARPWHGPVKGMSQWARTEPHPYTYDPDAARRLLAEAGHGGGLVTELWYDNQPSCVRMAEILATAWAEVGVQAECRDAAGAPAGWLPPLYLRSECGHNLSDPIYDLAHDYAAMHPLLPLPGGEPHVGNWRPRWKKNPEVLAEYTDLLLEPDRGRKQQRHAAFQDRLVELSTSIFLGEIMQVIAVNESVPAALVADDSHFFHALAYQNCTTAYLPPRS